MAGETELDELLAAASRVRMAPSEVLMARILADAEALQPPMPQALPTRLRQSRAGLWWRLAQALGGTGAVTGLGTAMVAGLAIGLAQPTAFSLITGGYLTMDAAPSGTDEALFPDMTLFLTEDQG